MKRYGLAAYVLQEVLVRAHRRWAHIEQLDVPEVYVRRMIVNEFISWRRKVVARRPGGRRRTAHRAESPMSPARHGGAADWQLPGKGTVGIWDLRVQPASATWSNPAALRTMTRIARAMTFLAHEAVRVPFRLAADPDVSCRSVSVRMHARSVSATGRARLPACWPAQQMPISRAAAETILRDADVSPRFDDTATWLAVR